MKIQEQSNILTRLEFVLGFMTKEDARGKIGILFQHYKNIAFTKNNPFGSFCVSRPPLVAVIYQLFFSVKLGGIINYFLENEQY